MSSIKKYMLKILTILFAFLVQLINYCQYQVVLAWIWRRTGMEMDLYGCKNQFPTGFGKDSYS